MRKFLLILILFFGQLSFADNAIHPTPKEPKLISADLLKDLKKSFIAPPEINSAVQKDDEKQLKDFQAKRTAGECERANSEVYVSLASFYGKPYGSLQKNEIDKLASFFEQIRNDADYYIQTLKKEFPRKRPFLYIEGLTTCVPKEVTGAYPSGHSTLARLYALILSDIFPDKKKVLLDRSLEIATDRVLAGVHHPTDIEAGKQLAEKLYVEFSKSEKYQKLFKEKKGQK